MVFFLEMIFFFELKVFWGLRIERRRRGDEKWMEKEVSGRWRTFMKVGERERE